MESFRSEVKTWLQENCPAGVKGPAREEDTVWGGRNAIWPSEDARLWLQAMGEKGWTCPTWPKKYGVPRNDISLGTKTVITITIMVMSILLMLSITIMSNDR